MNKKGSPAFLFYSGDFLMETLDCTWRERGMIITLLCLQHQKGHLSAQQIRHALRVAPPPGVLSLLERDGDGLYFHRGLEEAICRRQSFVESRQRNLAGAAASPASCDSDLSFSDHMAHQNGRHMENENENENENGNGNRSGNENQNRSGSRKSGWKRNGKPWGEESTHSFDAEEFMAAAIRRTYGDNA